MANGKIVRRIHDMEFGATIRAGEGVCFNLWAPGARQVDLCLERPGDRDFFPMESLPEGWYHLQVPRAGAGDLYRFRIDSDLLVPDPASRCQAHDIHGPSLVIDPAAYSWHDGEWRGRPWEEAVIYELHVGAFTESGTFAGVAERLDYLADLGVTAIELMPVADFPGQRNWGYDGALLFAPARPYGRPDDLKDLVQAAHRRGLMVFLDVVYNHFGPEGNYLHVYAREAFFTETFHTPWGAAINFKGAVRDFFVHNALYWLEEYHIDGFRLDAVHAIFDASSPDILEEIATAVRNGPGRERHIHLVLENDKNEAHYLCRTFEGSARCYTAQWNDDLHHSCHVLLTGEQDGYYGDYAEAPLHHLGRCLAQGFAYQGEVSLYRRGAMRGEKSSHLPPGAFVSFLQNHDQIGNRAFGERLTELAVENIVRLTTALLLLAPSPILLFMGEEFGASTPFLYFCDFGPELAGLVTAGRRREFARFSKFVDPELRARIPDPNHPETFRRSRLKWHELESQKGGQFHRFHKKLLELRRRHIMPRLAGTAGGQARYRILGPRALEVFWLLGDGSKLRVMVNFGEEPVEIGEQQLDALLYTLPENPFASKEEGRALSAMSIAWFLELRAEAEKADGSSNF